MEPGVVGDSIGARHWMTMLQPTDSSVNGHHARAARLLSTEVQLYIDPNEESDKACGNWRKRSYSPRGLEGAIDLRCLQRELSCGQGGLVVIPGRLAIILILHSTKSTSQRQLPSSSL